MWTPFWPPSPRDTFGIAFLMAVVRSFASSVSPSSGPGVRSISATVFGRGRLKTQRNRQQRLNWTRRKDDVHCMNRFRVRRLERHREGVAEPRHPTGKVPVCRVPICSKGPSTRLHLYSSHQSMAEQGGPFENGHVGSIPFASRGRRSPEQAPLLPRNYPQCRKVRGPPAVRCELAVVGRDAVYYSRKSIVL